MNLNYANFLACLYFASDWFRNNQLLSQFTHAQYRCTVPLNSCKGLSYMTGYFRTLSDSSSSLSACTSTVYNRQVRQFLRRSDTFFVMSLYRILFTLVCTIINLNINWTETYINISNKFSEKTDGLELNWALMLWLMLR